MHTYRDAKRMAKVLESSLREKNVDISHGESLNIVAKQFGLDDWNTLSARISGPKRPMRAACKHSIDGISSASIRPNTTMA